MPINLINIGQMKINSDDFRRSKVELSSIKNGLKRATTNAVNSTITQLYREAVKRFTSLTTIDRKKLKSRIYTYRASLNHDYAMLRLYTRKTGLTNFKFQDTRPSNAAQMRFGSKRIAKKLRGTGVYVEIYRGIKQQLPHSFVARGMAGKSKASNSNWHVFHRRGQKRLPLVDEKISLFQVFKSSGIKSDLESMAQGMLDKTFREKVQQQLDKYIK